ncbi:MAG: nitrate reductase [Chromatiaceae bacterium]
MSFLTVLYASLFYFAAAVLAAGLTYKVVQYARTPAPLKIPTTPAPTTRSGVVFRIAREVVLFESLFKGSKWTWIFGWMFHFGLFLVLLRHLRYFIDPVWLPIQLVQPFGIYGGIAMVVGLVGLWGRQPLPADLVLMLHLLLVIGLMLIFPFSKLLHGPGLFFSPTRNQVDNPREQRHIADWARRLEQS